MGSRHGLRPRG